jgi:hypothetical protein
LYSIQTLKWRLFNHELLDDVVEHGGGESVVSPDSQRFVKRLDGFVHVALK